MFQPQNGFKGDKKDWSFKNMGTRRRRKNPPQPPCPNKHSKTQPVLKGQFTHQTYGLNR